MDAQRALLDSLMGFNRDGDRPDEASMSFSHPRVCKPYLCGLCPRELFQNTRLDAGACQSLHLPTLRATYEQEKRDFGYERALAKELTKLLADVEKKIARAQRRLDEDGATERATQLLEQVQVVKRKRTELPTDALDNVNQKLRVCDVCGAFLSIFDSERRLADHFGGKVHVGYVQIRQKLKELMDKQTGEKQVKRPRSRSRSRREDRPRARSRSREGRSRRKRSVSSSRSRSRSRERRRRRHRR
ncbi:MRNA splicing factor [Phytophthora megakarya]|uniref:mRNA splicing factor n=1 Tax=Phytophthora megakarya TaxID=4795 RepID=A0A225WIJ9_9STRA|nr:MRNA splicing factor [Phytophthora megakarya]